MASSSVSDRLMSPIGPLPRDWQLVRLQDIATKIGTGATPRGGDKVYLPQRNQYALIRSQHVFDRHFDHSGLAFIRDEHAQELRNAEVLCDDLLLNITGDGITFGRACRADPSILPACVNQHVSIIRLNPQKAVPGYVLSYLTHPAVKRYIESFNAGGSRRAITKGNIESFEIPLPPVAEQIRIAETLSAFDSKIELNRRTNETLEAIARALFKSWFIDFDPVREKAAGRKPAGFDFKTAALFPDRFVDSPLGKIPEGWSVVRLGDYVEAAKGLSYKGSGLADAGIPLHNLNSVYEGGGYKFQGIKWYTGEYRERHLIHPGDVIVANTEQGHDCLLIGYAAIVPDTFGIAGLFSHHLYHLSIRPGSPLTADFLFRLLNSQRMHEVVSGYGNGTTVNMLPGDALQQPMLVSPPTELITRYTDLAGHIRRRCAHFVSENRHLAMTRDTLLPKLLSGDLSVE